MSGYCPAGKCECGNYHSERHDSKVGEFSFAYYTKACRGEGWEIDIKDIEQCPWPSRQQIVGTQKTEIKLCPLCGLHHEQAVDGCNAHVVMFGKGFASGRLAGLQEARGAVANIRLRFDSDTPGNVDLTLPEFQWVRNKALAAIDWLMEGE